MLHERSLTGKKWLLRKGSLGENIVSALADERGIHLGKEVLWSSLSDPLGLSSMNDAIERIHHAIKTHETVGIIGDYDADGITGTAQLVRYFRRHRIEPEVILPHRIRHGYGVKKEFVEEMHKKNASLIITVDTGITAIEEIAYARSLGIDVIVTDHHSHSEELPDAIIVHPSVEISNPPSERTFVRAGKPQISNLSGAGVVFTLIRALEGDEWDEQHIDCALAAIGTVADIVPLSGENRTIVHLGLQALDTASANPVFDLARSVLNETECMTSSHIGFRIAPRINAAGRIDDPLLALTALLEGGEAIEKLQFLNEKRQHMTQTLCEEAEKLIDHSHPILTCSSKDFHHGIVGLIAGRLTERYGKPSVIGVEHEGEITCSLRSIPQYHITNALRRCSDYLESCGGHAQAAGCTLDRGSWRALCATLTDDAAEHLDAEDLVPTIVIDAEMNTTDVTLDFVRSLAQLEPFGAANHEPRFLLRNQSLSALRCVGQDQQHLQCRIGAHKAIGFNLGHLKNIPTDADIVCRLGVDSWNGTEGVQVFVEDIAIPTKTSVDLVAHEALID